MEHTKIEGYWYSADEPQYPKPVAHLRPSPTQAVFLEKLTKLESKAQKRHFKGWSNCRLCKKPNGSSEFTLKGWRWPEGYRHYIQDHNVRPSPEFKDFVLKAKTS
jgi:hypothetical protein